MDMEDREWRITVRSTCLIGKQGEVVSERRRGVFLSVLLRRFMHTETMRSK